jgi:hypothetical protein
MKIIFDVQHLYYLPQYLPVINALHSQAAQQHAAIDVSLVCYRTGEQALDDVISKVTNDVGVSVFWVDEFYQAKAYYQYQKADWIVFGNAVDDLDDIHQFSKTALMQHGIGPKSCYYDVSENPTTVRFVEGEHRLKRLQQRFPNAQFVDTGYAKLDPLINQTEVTLTHEMLGLDVSKPTLLYAPTFYPSSIEKFPVEFAKEFEQYNIIVKPHFFSLTKSKYRKQRTLLDAWARHSNVYLAKVEDYNLTPFMGLADVMLSDASSAIFEFAALQKPVIWCDFYQLRWSYRGIFSYRFKQRLDPDIEFFNKVALRAGQYKDIASLLHSSLHEGDAVLTHKTQTISQLAGQVDGKCAQRIAEFFL